MSVTVTLYEYEESMDDKILRSMGVQGGIIGQLTTEDVELSDETELLQNAEDYTVGNSGYDFPRKVLDEINGVMIIDSKLINTIEDAADELAYKTEGHYSASETVEWLKNHEGEKIFARGL